MCSQVVRGKQHLRLCNAGAAKSRVRGRPIDDSGPARVVLSFSDLGTKGSGKSDVTTVSQFVDLSVRSGVGSGLPLTVTQSSIGHCAMHILQRTHPVQPRQALSFCASLLLDIMLPCSHMLLTVKGQNSTSRNTVQIEYMAGHSHIPSPTVATVAAYWQAC